MPYAIVILVAAFITACISGIFGMAGGMIFMAVITVFLGVSEAMVVHGAVQSVSNASRSYLLRRNIRWDVLGFKLMGALPVIIILFFVSYIPNKKFLFLLLGLLPLLLWLPKGWVQGDAEKPAHAILCGVTVMTLNISAGVAGPALDFFYVKTGLSRQEIVSTKAVTMFASHLVKIGYFGIPLIQATGFGTLPPLWVFVAALPCIIIGTYIGTLVLHKLDDINFKSYTKYLVTLIGFVYLARAFGWL